MYEKRQKMEFLDLKYLLFGGIFFSRIGGYPLPPLTENTFASQSHDEESPPLNQFLSGHQALTLMSCLYNFRRALWLLLTNCVELELFVQIGWWQTSAAGRYSRPWPWHSPAGPVAIHCAAGSPFVTVSQLTSPPEHPQFSVFPHEKIHGNLKT